MNPSDLKNPLVIYDGECKFCHWNVDLILKHEKSPVVKFAWLQSPSIQKWLESEGVPVDFDTFLIYDNGRFYKKSEAAVRISKQLKFPYNLIGLIRILPASWSDACYDLVARNRKKIMGSTSCALPIGQESRFID